jgi:spermidine/putrescine transport system ATP-binding protein
VMNTGRFEQIDTPVNLYNAPQTPFVARFVGDNNAWSGKVESVDGAFITAVTPEGHRIQTKSARPLVPGDPVDLFVRPETMLIQPDPDISGLNRFDVFVKSDPF